jgi:hypothetical protein
VKQVRIEEVSAIALPRGQCVNPSRESSVLLSWGGGVGAEGVHRGLGGERTKEPMRTFDLFRGAFFLPLAPFALD